MHYDKEEKPSMRSTFQQIFLLNNEDQGYCQETAINNRFSFLECDNFPLEQQWMKYKMPLTPGLHIILST